MVKIAVVDSFPNLDKTAEKEFIERLIIAGRNIGVCVVKVVTTDDIYRENPDFVIASHEFTPKCTSYITLGAMWSPNSFFENDPIRVRNVLSYDGYLVGSEKVSLFLKDLVSTIPNNKKISSFIFLPTSQRSDNKVRASISRTLMYAGVHWDGLRHAELFYLLNSTNTINLYGPPDSWRYVSKSYRGEILFDGTSMITTIKKHGIALCLHKSTHVYSNTPSMRLFEAASAGAVIITDQIQFAKDVFGDSIFYLDTNLSPYQQAEFIRKTVEWVNSNPLEASSMADRAQKVFDNEWCLENLIPKVISFAQEIRNDRYTLLSHSLKSNVNDLDVIIRCGSRDLKILDRAITSVLNQDGIKTRVVLVDYIGRDDILHYIVKFKDRVKYFRSDQTGYRSTALWDGLRLIEANYFSVLDDDDWVENDHWVSHISALNDVKYSKYKFAYSGVVRVEEDGAHILQSNFNGPLCEHINECRELKFLDFHDQDRLLTFDNYIQSNSWVAKKELLQYIPLDDPMLNVAEDMYLYILFYSITEFLFIPVQTAYWSWRSNSSDNSMLSVSQDIWMANHKRLLTRLKYLVMRTGKSFYYEYNNAHYNLNNKNFNAPSLEIQGVSLSNNISFDQNQFQSIVQKDGFHAAEINGVWSRNTFSWFRGFTTEFITIASVSLEFFAAGVGSNENVFVDIYVNGYSLYSGSVTPYQKVSVNKYIFSDVPTNSFTYILACKKLFRPCEFSDSSDVRQLGIFICGYSVSSLPLNSPNLKDLELSPQVKALLE